MRRVKIDKYIMNDSTNGIDGKILWDFNWSFLHESSFNELTDHTEVKFSNLIVNDNKKTNFLKNKWL